MPQKSVDAGFSLCGTAALFLWRAFSGRLQRRTYNRAKTTIRSPAHLTARFFKKSQILKRRLPACFFWRPFRNSYSAAGKLSFWGRTNPPFLCTVPKTDKAGETIAAKVLCAATLCEILSPESAFPDAIPLAPSPKRVICNLQARAKTGKYFDRKKSEHPRTNF